MCGYGDGNNVLKPMVGEAVNGHHELATFHLHTPHLTLMDFIMSKMNGLETARHLTVRHPDILILWTRLST
jgi:DNA-binding NarL/FixJ family response regulator